MIYVTESPNDSDLASALGSLAIVAPIPHGDCVFFGVAEGRDNIRVCIERKKVHDIAACMTDGRYLAQAQAAHGAGFEYLVLIIEGLMRPSRRDGMVETPRGAGWVAMLPHTSYSRLNTYLDEVSLYMGVLVKRSASVTETAAQIKSLWQMFQRPPSEHQSLKKIYSSELQHTLLSRPSLVRRMAKELPGIGWDRSLAVDEHFCSVVAMVGAGEGEWASLAGIGPKTAKRVTAAMKAMRGGA